MVLKVVERWMGQVVGRCSHHADTYHNSILVNCVPIPLQQVANAMNAVTTLSASLYGASQPIPAAHDRVACG